MKRMGWLLSAMVLTVLSGCGEGEAIVEQVTSPNASSIFYS